MSTQISHEGELAEDRERLLRELIAEQGPNWLEQFKPGSLGCHELLDRTAFLAAAVYEQLAEHPSCVQNEEWFALASTAVAALNDLYQKVGAAHL